MCFGAKLYDTHVWKGKSNYEQLNKQVLGGLTFDPESKAGEKELPLMKGFRVETAAPPII